MVRKLHESLMRMMIYLLIFIAQSMSYKLTMYGNITKLTGVGITFYLDLWEDDEIDLTKCHFQIRKFYLTVLKY